MAALLFLLQPWLQPLPPVLALILLIAAGATTFFAVAQLSGALDLGELRAMLRRR
jgi:hypothetical protein